MIEANYRFEVRGGHVGVTARRDGKVVVSIYESEPSSNVELLMSAADLYQIGVGFQACAKHADAAKMSLEER